MRSVLITIALCLFSLSAQAQHSDIWLLLDSNRVTISPQNIETGVNTLIDQTTGQFLFIADFGDLGGGPFGTDDPGYQAQSGTFTPNVILGYQATDQLRFWNGSQWTTALPDNERITYMDALGTTTSWDGAGVSNADGAIDQVGGDGSIHSHLDFTIGKTSGSGDPSTGAYLIELSLISYNGLGGPVVHQLSDPFRIVFNNQMSANDFDQAVAALTAETRRDFDTDIPFLPLPFMILLFGLLSAVAVKFQKGKT